MLRDTAGREGDALIHFLCCGLFNPSVLWTPPLYFVFQNTPQCYGARQGRWRIVQACCIADILIDRKEIKKRGYIETMYPLFIERKTRLKLATLSLEG